MAARRKIKTLIKNGFSKIWNKQFLIFLFFLVLSSSFWLFQTLNETYERTFSVPVTLENVPGNVVITTELPENVSLTLKDKGVVLYNYVYGQKFNPVVIDYNVYTTPGGHARILSADVMKQIKPQLMPGTQVLSLKPDTLEFYYNYGLSKRVPVKFQGGIRTNSLYYLSKQTLSHDSVTVYASKSTLDTITAAHLTPFYVTDLADTLITPVEVQPVKGVKFIPKEVTLSLYVDRLIEKTVQVPIQWVNFPATKVLRTFPSKVNITFQVGMSNYRKINAENFVLVVDYESLLGNPTNSVHLSLKSVPEGAYRVRINPQDVEYVIEELAVE